MKYSVLNINKIAFYIIEYIDDKRYRLLEKHIKNSPYCNSSLIGSIGYLKDLRTDLERIDFETLEDAKMFFMIEIL